MRFADKPNARNVIGEPVIVSDCQHFRIQEIVGQGFWAHTRRLLKDKWSGIPGQPFNSRDEAIAACRSLVPEKLKGYGKRRQQIHADAV